jgi:hypothetical protein
VKFAAIAFGVAMIGASAPVANAQAINPLQAAAIAETVVGLVFDAMNPTPKCGPHEAIPRPYQPTTPSYTPPPSRPDQHASLDDDDDEELKPLKPRPSRPPGNYSLQPQTRPNAEDEPDQPSDIGTRDAGQSAYETAANDDAGQPVQHHRRHRPVHRSRPTQNVQRPSPSIETTQNSGQVAEIPSLPQH